MTRTTANNEIALARNVLQTEAAAILALVDRLDERFEAAVRLPVVHIADATARAVRDAGLTRVALLGTRFTMEQPFYCERLERGGLEIITPAPAERDDVHRIIYDELCRGRIEPASRERYRSIMTALVGRGAQGIVLGCTEIGLLVRDEDAAVPLFDTTAIHAKAIADRAIDG